MDPSKTTAVVDAATKLADKYAETQLWGVIAFFSVLVVVQFTTMVFLLLKKDKSYTSLIEANAEADQIINQTFEQRHKEYVDVLRRSMEAINKNSAALTKLSDRMGITDENLIAATDVILEQIEENRDVVLKLKTQMEDDNA